jgi:hypothetical protein
MVIGHAMNRFFRIGFLRNGLKLSMDGWISLCFKGLGSQPGLGADMVSETHKVLDRVGLIQQCCRFFGG